jgi:leucyl-tRNA synthetase
LCEEIWSELGHKTSLTFEKWPEADPKFLTDKNFELVIQVNGKVRDTMIVTTDISEEEAKQKAMQSEKVQKWLEGREPKKVIYVKGKLISIVI